MSRRRRRVPRLGRRFGQLVVTDYCEHAVGEQTSVVCRCDCGTLTRPRVAHLRSGATRSCGGPVCARRGKRVRPSSPWDAWGGIAEAAKIAGVTTRTLSNRLRRGLTALEAVEQGAEYRLPTVEAWAARSPWDVLRRQDKKLKEAA